MDRLQPVDLALHRLGQFVIRLMHVDVLRVAAAARQCHRVEDRRLGRRRVVRVIGVEGLARDHAPVAEEFLVRHVIHLGKARDVMVLLVMRLQFAPELNGALEIGRLVFLVAHDEHVVLGKRRVEDGPGLGIDRLGQIEAADFGPGVLGQGRDCMRHGVFSSADGRLREIYAPPATPSIALYACPHPNAPPQAEEGISSRRWRMMPS